MLLYQFFGKLENDFGEKLLMCPVYAILSDQILSSFMSMLESSLRELLGKLESWIIASSWLSA